MKKIVFLIIATLLVVGLVLPGCAGGDGEERPPITFAIAGPMTELQGEHHWWGAELARDEINAGTGVNVGGVYHKVALVQVDTNEMTGTPDKGVNALEVVIDDVDFVLGGFRSDCVVAYREVAMDAKKVFMDCGAARAFLQYSVVEDYDRYKYFLRTAPYNEMFLVKSLLKMTTPIATMLKDTLIGSGDAVTEDYRVSEDGKLRVAILMDDALWCAQIVATAQSVLPHLGFTVVGTWRVAPRGTNITTELSQIAAAKPHIIFTGFSSSIGDIYSMQKAALGIPAMTIGINVPGQVRGHWANTEGKCNGEIMLDTWAEGLQNTAKTTAFFSAFVAKTGEYPLYTAVTYDAIYSLKEAIEAVSAAHGWDDIADVVDPANIDALIQYFETSPYTATSGKIAYYPMPELDLGGGVYALSETQVRTLYPSSATYDQADWLCAASGGPHIAHDLVYGPGYATGIGSQWQDGKKVGVWPIDLGDDYDAALTDQYGCWNFEYPGTADVVIPIERFLEHVIKIAVVGPMTDIQGENQWDGATMAVEEINDAGGVDISGTKYTVELVKVETNEATEGEDGSTGTANLEAVIDDVAFVVGGFRTQVVQVYREVAMTAKRIFMNCGAATGSLQFDVVTNYEKYKYWFKASPYNESFIVNASFKITGTIGKVLRQTLEDYGDAVAQDYKVPEDGKLRVAILMEDAPWCAGMVTAAQSYLPGYGFTTVGTWLASPTASDISTELSQIAVQKPHIIFTAFSGSVSDVYSVQKNSLGIPAMTIGINVPGEQLSHWVNTDGKCEGEIMITTWGVGMENTETTVDWFNDYMARTGRYPIYTALTYDAIRRMCRAIAATDSLDSDTLVTWLEDPAHAMTDSVSATKIMYYPMPEVDLGGGVYALSEAQVRTLYPSLATYNQADWLCAASGGPHIAHDLVYGPGYVTGVGAQWQEIGGAGAKAGIWPMNLGPAYDAALTDQYGCWNFEYPGTADVVIPIERFLAS